VSTTAPVFGEPSAGAKVRGRLFLALLWLCLALSALVLAVLVGDTLNDGAGQLTWEFLTSPPSSIPALAGIEPAIIGTLWLMLVCAVFIIPVGVAAAVYLEEFADAAKWWNRLIEVNIQNLAAVPSIVYGILGLAYVVRGPLDLGRVVLAGALTLGLLVLPVVIIAAREALRAIPPSITEGSLALGATPWQTVWKQVLPAAIPGIATGVILALSRAIGETAPLIVIGAATFAPVNPTSLNDQFTALPIQIFNWLSQPQEEYQLKAAAGILVLLAILVLMNSVAIYLRNRFESKW
jgi:phosphate transport system permease protein